ncbi:MAG: DUF86 domain-containing protein [Flavisolibacter sp.]|nr:DUF86 domain-containing protein [Flavisolibacter sp.]
MDIELKVWLYDIINAIHEIETFLRDTSEFAEYQNDLKTKRAVERNLAIIGEAMSRILNKDTSIQLSNARKIVDTRNRIIHGYDTVSDEVLWGIITNHLPILKSEVEQLFDE